MLDPKNIFPIGIGTWGIGGFMEHNPDNDDKGQIEALIYSIEKGANYIDVATMYGGGYSLHLIKEAIGQFDRSSLFINAKLTGEINSPNDVEEKTNFYLKELKLDYLDSIMLHAPWRSMISLEETFTAMQKEVEKKGARFLSLSNCKSDQLDLFRTTTGMPLFANELDYNFEVRVSDDLGITRNCLENNTRVICFQPLRRSETAKRDYPILVELAKKYNKTQNQIILNWLTHKDLFMPIVKSASKEHIDENFDSLNFKMTAKDYKDIENYKIDFEFPEPDLNITGKGVRISNFSLYLSEHLK